MFGPNTVDGFTSRLPDVIANNLPQDPTTMFDFSTLDPNFMSLVNSFDNTFQAPQAFPPVQQRSPQQQQQQPVLSQQAFTQQQQQTQPNYSSQQTSMTSESNPSNESSTGLTPFLNPDYTSPNSSGPSPPVTTGYASAADLAPTPGHHFELLSKTVNYNVNGGAIPTAAEANGSAYRSVPSQSSQSQSQGQTPSSSIQEPWMSLQNDIGPGDGSDILLSQALGEKSPEDDLLRMGRDHPPPSTYSNSFQMPSDTRAGQGAGMDTEGFELVGGWFDANDLPRVARDHL